MISTNFQQWLLSEETIVIDKRTRLFHGTIEEFSTLSLKPGGFDKILWFTEDPVIAQMYIPKAGLIAYSSPKDLAKPVQNENLHQVQRLVGLNFDYSDVEWAGPHLPKSYRIPNGWEGDPDIRAQKIADILNSKGFEIYKEGYNKISNTYEFRFHEGRLLMPNEKVQGKLFIATVREPLQIYDMTSGGRLEGDLTSPQYYKLDVFRKIEEQGFDGVKIGDHVLSKIWGPIPHFSIGVFRNSIPKLQWESIPASHPDTQDTSPEYESYLRSKR